MRPSERFHVLGRIARKQVEVDLGTAWADRQGDHAGKDRVDRVTSHDDRPCSDPPALPGLVEERPDEAGAINLLYVARDVDLIRNSCACPGPKDR